MFFGADGEVLLILLTGQFRRKPISPKNGGGVRKPDRGVIRRRRRPIHEILPLPEDFPCPARRFVL